MTEEQEKKFFERLDSLSKLVMDHAVGVKAQSNANTQGIYTGISTLEKKLNKIMKHLGIPQDDR